MEGVVWLGLKQFHMMFGGGRGGAVAQCSGPAQSDLPQCPGSVAGISERPIWAAKLSHNELGGSFIKFTHLTILMLLPICF